jgi:Peptidase propeptide and YPEB domain.
MKSKVTLLVSVFLSASILTLIGGILTMSGNQQKAQANASATQASSQQSTQNATYQGLLDQANQTISQANAEIVSLQNQIQQQSTSTATSTPYPVLADQASAIASNATGEVVVNIPRLVNYNGKAAYEVTFSNGKVYVDASSGSILYNGIAVVKNVTGEQAAQIAINYTGNTSVAGIAYGTYNGSLAYQITFQNGELVYVDVHGTVLAIQVPSSSQGSGGSNSGGNSEGNDD